MEKGQGWKRDINGKGYGWKRDRDGKEVGMEKGYRWISLERQIKSNNYVYDS